MPIHVDRVETGRNPFGDLQICCAHCHQPANYTTTVGPDDTLLLELMCPAGAVELGTGWINEEQRSADVRAYLARNPLR